MKNAKWRPCLFLLLFLIASPLAVQAQHDEKTATRQDVIALFRELINGKDADSNPTFDSAALESWLLTWEGRPEERRDPGNPNPNYNYADFSKLRDIYDAGFVSGYRSNRRGYIIALVPLHATVDDMLEIVAKNDPYRITGKIFPVKRFAELYVTRAVDRNGDGKINEKEFMRQMEWGIPSIRSVTSSTVNKHFISQADPTNRV